MRQFVERDSKATGTNSNKRHHQNQSQCDVISTTVRRSVEEFNGGDADAMAWCEGGDRCLSRSGGSASLYTPGKVVKPCWERTEPNLATLLSLEQENERTPRRQLVLDTYSSRE
jgi:hypothetical protein